MNTSYTYSRLVGNYSGLTSSDENGRNAPERRRASSTVSTCRSTRTATRSTAELQTDRPHYFKLQGTYDLPWGTGVGANYLGGERHAAAEHDHLQERAGVRRRAAATWGARRSTASRTSSLQQDIRLAGHDASTSA